MDRTWAQDDGRLIHVIQESFLHRPPPLGPLRLTQVRDIYDSRLAGQFGQAARLEKFFKGLERGFFLECGAVDGETYSNTLLFEMKYNWTGVLVEPNPATYRALQRSNRNVFSLNVCLSPSRWPEVLTLSVVTRLLGRLLPLGMVSHLGKASDWLGGDSSSTIEEVSSQCLPLYSVLLSLGNPTVHYLSLDVEGAEEAVLSTVPWDQVDIRVVGVEISHSNSSAVQALMGQAGYTLNFSVGEDLFFVKNGYRP